MILFYSMILRLFVEKMCSSVRFPLVWLRSRFCLVVILEQMSPGIPFAQCKHMPILWKAPWFPWLWLRQWCGDILRRPGVETLLSACSLNRINPWRCRCLGLEGPGGQAHHTCYLVYSVGEGCKHHMPGVGSAFTRGNRIRHGEEHDPETSETVNSDSVPCKHRWTASKLLVGHLRAAANGRAWWLTAQESFLRGEGSLQRHMQPLNWGAAGGGDMSEGQEHHQYSVLTNMLWKHWARDEDGLLQMCPRLSRVPRRIQAIVWWCCSSSFRALYRSKMLRPHATGF